MRVGLYCNWGIKKHKDNYYLSSVDYGYLCAFKKHSNKITLLSKTRDVPPTLTDKIIKDISIIELPYFDNYINAIKYIFNIISGILKLTKNSDFIYIRTPEPFGWSAVFGKIFKKITLHYHYTSSPIDVIKGYKTNLFIRYSKIFLFLPEYYLTALVAFFNNVSCIGNSGKNKLPFFLKNKAIALYEASYEKSNMPTLRKEKIFNQEEIRFLYVGRLVASKGLEEMIESIFLLKKNINYKFNFSIVGDGILRDKLEYMVENYNLNDVVNFNGLIEFGTELDNVYQLHDVLVSPSYSETGPRTVLEAVTNNLYIISTDVGFVKEILYKDNKNLCTLIEIGSVISLVNAYNFVYNNKELCISKSQEAKRITTHLTLDSFIKNIIQGRTNGI